MHKNQQKPEQKVNIELTKDQFLALLKAVYLGNWMANAQRDGSPEDPLKEDYDAIEDYILSYARQFGFVKYVDDEDGKKGRFYPTRVFEEKTDVHELREEYDEETFWDELIDRLGERDFHRRYSEAEIKKMSEDEYFKKLYACQDRWAREVEEHGLERI